MDTKNNFPKTLVEAIAQYSNDEHAHETMAGLRWPAGVCCPHCGDTKVKYLAKYRRWECSNKHAKRQFTVKVGTVFEDSPIAIGKWLMVIWMLTADKNGISSYEIHRAIGVTQKTAWFMMHRVRLALQSGSFEKMTGIVEADESYVGGATKNLHKSKLKALREMHKRPDGSMRKLANDVRKTVVMGMLQRGEDGKSSQARMQLIDSAHGRHLHGVIRDNVEPGSALMTDPLKGYTMLRADYVHQAVNHVVEYVRGNVHTNGLENFWSLMKRALKGTYVAVEPFHMMRYLDEQCFRFNNRDLTDGERFEKALGGVFGKRLTYAELTGKVGGVEEKQPLPS